MKHSLAGITHLSQDAQGYIYWKGRSVEHYSHERQEDFYADALALAQRCQALEKKGLPVTSRTAICPVLEQMPADSAWRRAALRFYSLAQGNGRFVATLYQECADAVVILERDAHSGQVRFATMSEAYDAFHYVQAQGLKSIAPVRTYEQLHRFMQASGLQPQDIDRALDDPGLPSVPVVAA